MVTLAYAALWMFVFSVPWERMIVIPGVGILSRLTGMIALGLALIAMVVTGRMRPWRGFHLAALLFVILAGLSVITLRQIPPKFWTYVLLMIVVWMVWELAPTRKRVLGLLTAYVLGAYVAALETILLARSQAGLRRFAAGGVDPNDFAMTLALALPMAWYLGITYHRPIMRWICRAYVPIGFMAVILTGSRGGMLTSIVAMLVVPLTMTRLSPGRLATVILVLIVSGSLVVVYVPDSIKKRLGTTTTSVEDLSLGGRFRIWQGAVKAFAQQPFFGYGTAEFKNAVRPFGVGQLAHNSYLSILVEQGLVGFLLWATMFITVIMAALRMPRLERRFALILLAALGVAMTPLTFEDRRPVWFILSILVALAAAPAAVFVDPRRQYRGPIPAPSAYPPRAPRPPFEPTIAHRRGGEPGATP
jgi:O-antigen ligase